MNKGWTGNGVTRSTSERTANWSGVRWCMWVADTAQTAPVLDLPWAQLVEWQGGLRWLWAPLDAGAQLQAAAKAAGGNATVFVAACAYSVSASSYHF